MNLRQLGFLFTTASTATLVYGALVEANRLVVERRWLSLPHWPERLNGFKIALLADFHLRDEYSVALGKRAVALALDENPDFVVLAGDYVGYWKPASPWMLGEVLSPLAGMEGAVVAVPGNHDYWSGDASLLSPIFDELNIKLLRNEVWTRSGIEWVGIDSANAKRADPVRTMSLANSNHPKVVVWHEPDVVDWLPSGGSIMLSGHSHGGQFTLPWGWTPIHTKNGERYVQGFFPDAPTPLYVSRGIGTTGPPARLGCTPEVAILELFSQ